MPAFGGGDFKVNPSYVLHGKSESIFEYVKPKENQRGPEKESDGQSEQPALGEIPGHDIHSWTTAFQREGKQVAK